MARGPNSVIVHRGEVLLIVALCIQFTWSWRSTNCLRNGFSLSHCLCLQTSICINVSQTLTFCPVSVPLRDPVWYRVMSSPERGSVHGNNAYKGVNNDSFELAVKWKLRMLKKDIWPLHLYICQTILQLTDKMCTLNALYVLESNQWPWHCWCRA